MDINALATNPDWGSLADWFGAIGTIAAVIVALGFGLADRQRLKIERAEAAEDRKIFRQERAEQAEEYERRFAAKVTVHVERVSVPDPEAQDGQRRGIKWEVHNGGEVPISTVCIVQTLRPGAPGADQTRYQIDHIWRVLKPGQDVEKTVAFDRDSTDYEPFREVWFTDGAGKRWSRNHIGSLGAIGRDDPRRSGFAIPLL